MTTPIEVTEEDRQKALELLNGGYFEARISLALAEARLEGRRDTERLNWLTNRADGLAVAWREWNGEEPFRDAIDRSMEAEDSACRTE